MKKPTFEIPRFDIPPLDYYWQYVDHWSGVDPDFPSLREGTRTLTARQFKEASDQLAQAFLRLGVKKGDRIVSILPTGIDYVLTLVASHNNLLAMEALLVPMDVKFRTKDLERFLSHAKPSLILSITGVKDFNTVEKLKGLGGEFADITKVLVGSTEFGYSFEELFTRAGTQKALPEHRRRLSDYLHRRDDGGAQGGPPQQPQHHFHVLYRVRLL